MCVSAQIGKYPANIRCSRFTSIWGNSSAQDMHGLGQPIHFLAGEKARAKPGFSGCAARPRGHPRAASTCVSTSRA